MRKVLSISSDKTGYVTFHGGLTKAKAFVRACYKEGIKMSIYIDWFDTEEDIDPVKSIAYFVNEDGIVYKSKY